jgi:hypothetical protein
MTDGFIPASDREYRFEIVERDGDYWLTHKTAYSVTEWPIISMADGESAALVVAADRRIAELEADQRDWRKGVELIASSLGEFAPANLSCVRIAEVALGVRAEAEQLAEARSLIDELAEQLIEHSSTNGSAKIPSHHKANTVLAKVEAYRKEQA